MLGVPLRTEEEVPKELTAQILERLITRSIGGLSTQGKILTIGAGENGVGATGVVVAGVGVTGVEETGVGVTEVGVQRGVGVTRAWVAGVGETGEEEVLIGEAGGRFKIAKAIRFYINTFRGSDIEKWWSLTHVKRLPFLVLAFSIHISRMRCLSSSLHYWNTPNSFCLFEFYFYRSYFSSHYHF